MYVFAFLVLHASAASSGKEYQSFPRKGMRMIVWQLAYHLPKALSKDIYIYILHEAMMKDWKDQKDFGNSVGSLSFSHLRVSLFHTYRGSFKAAML